MKSACTPAKTRPRVVYNIILSQGPKMVYAESDFSPNCATSSNPIYFIHGAAGTASTPGTTSTKASASSAHAVCS